MNKDNSKVISGYYCVGSIKDNCKKIILLKKEVKPEAQTTVSKNIRESNYGKIV